MNRLKLLLGSFTILSGFTLFAQNEDDALRYSQTFFGGSARNAAMAGALSALGGDFSVVTQNPAGLGRIRKTKVSGTLNIETAAIRSDFLGTSTSNADVKGNLSDFSYVKAYELDPNEYGNWYNVQLGMGATRIKSFNEEIRYQGTSEGSLLDAFVDEASGTFVDDIFDQHPFTAGLAFDVFAIDPHPTLSNEYITGISAGNVIQDRTLTRTGGMHEYSFSLSGNYGNKLLIGGSANFTRAKYTEVLDHNETYPDTSLFLNAINYTGSLETRGWGYGLRVGAIYLPTDFLNIGISAQLPTLYRLDDSWTNNITSQTTEGEKFVNPEFVPRGSFEYKLRTPFRGNASLGITTKLGVLGVEVEYVDYRKSFFKIGFEGRINSQTSIRGGFAYYGTPFKSVITNANLSPTLFYSGGFGYNLGSIYFDGAVVLQHSEENYFAYNRSINGSEVGINQNDIRVMLTIGFRID